MLYESENGRLLINEIAFQIIRKNAPAELPHFLTSQKQFYHGVAHDPERFEQQFLTENEGDTIGAYAVGVFYLAFLILSALTDGVNQWMPPRREGEAISWMHTVFVDEQLPDPVITSQILANIETKLSLLIEHKPYRDEMLQTAMMIKNLVITKLLNATAA